MELENNIKICYRDTLMNQAVEEPVDVDITLPDYCPDIEKILLTVFARPCVQANRLCRLQGQST